jgi:acetyl esterase/lipase
LHSGSEATTYSAHAFNRCAIAATTISTLWSAIAGCWQLAFDTASATVDWISMALQRNTPRGGGAAGSRAVSRTRAHRERAGPLGAEAPLGSQPDLSRWYYAWRLDEFDGPAGGFVNRLVAVVAGALALVGCATDTSTTPSTTLSTPETTSAVTESTTLPITTRTSTSAPPATLVVPTLGVDVSVYAEPPATPPFAPAKVGFSDRNVTYCIVGGVELKLDIFYPQTPPTQRYPLVVYIHGGQLLFGSKDAVAGPAAAINGPAYTARGFAFASINYRLGPDYRLPTMIEDVKCAVRYLRARAASYNINPDRIGVIGTSSGGYLVAMLGLAGPNAGFEGRGGFAGVSSRVQAVIPEYPQVSFELPSYSKAETDSRAGALPPNASASFLRTVSLPTYASREAPPFLFFHGDADPALSPTYSQDLHNKLAAAGVDSTFVLVKHAGHGWLATSPRLPNTTYGPEPTVQEILNQELAFFDKHLKK